jgi:hypothetical protein
MNDFNRSIVSDDLSNRNTIQIRKRRMSLIKNIENNNNHVNLDKDKINNNKKIFENSKKD